MITETIRRPLFPATAATGRFFYRILRWFGRTWWKILIWVVSLTALGWQYENWQGRRALAEQRALWIAEYGDLKWQDFAPPHIPDEENFFAAPVFETFVVKNPPPRLYAAGTTPELRTYYDKCHELAAALPHGRFLQMRFPEVKMCPGDLMETDAGEGLRFLDIAGWAKARRAAGESPPPGLTDAQWLHASMPEDETIRGFTAALTRKRAGILPNATERWKIGEQLNDPGAIPINALSNVFDAVTKISRRAAAAARAGDGRTARELNQILWRLSEGFGSASTLVGTLVALAVLEPANRAISEGLAAGCWQEADLAALAESLSVIDEEKTVRTGLYLEGFGLHMWPGELNPWLRKVFSTHPLKDWEGWCFRLIAWGPEGWLDTNKATMLRWWRETLTPDTPGDDLLALQKKMSESQKRQSERFGGTLSPRSIIAAMQYPAMSGIADNALKHQTRRRQLQLAIAIERYTLARGNPPPDAAALLVPDFLPAIPGDPWQPGTPLRYEPGRDGIRYRILSAGKDLNLAMPNTPAAAK